MVIIIRSKLLSALSGIEHGFGVGAADVRELLEVSRCIVFRTKQVHGVRVHVLENELRDRVLNGDAFVTSKPGLVCHVRTADCVPILIADKRNRAVAAVHAGWKGTALDVAGETIATMRDRFGTDPSECSAAVGPAICGRCYEVGREVIDEIARLELEGGWRIDDRHVDLGHANRELLKRAGIPPDNIDVLSHCTSCDTRFASWRRDRTGARQASFIYINKIN